MEMNDIQKNMIEKLDVLLDDQDFVDKICTNTDENTLKMMFLEKGVELDDTSVKVIQERLNQYAENGELTEAELELVAGGCKQCFSVALGAGLLAGFYSGNFVVGLATGIATYIVVKKTTHK